MMIGACCGSSISAGRAAPAAWRSQPRRQPAVDRPPAAAASAASTAPPRRPAATRPRRRSRRACAAAWKTTKPNSPPCASSTTNTGRSASGSGISRAMAQQHQRLDAAGSRARRRPPGRGWASTTAKSMLMPTAMKNRPSSRPLKGSRSVSSSRRYSLSASSTPARKAPSAIDRPTDCISAAVATTSSSDAAVKISGVSLRAIQRSAGRSSSRPPSTMAAITPTALAAPHQPPPSAGAGAGRGQQRQQRQDRDGGDVLQQRHAEHALAGAGGHQVALGQHAQADGGGRHRQAQRRPPAPAASRRRRPRRCPGSAAPSRTAARCPSRRSAGAAPTAAAAPAPGRPGTASARRRTRRSAGSSPRR